MLIAETKHIKNSTHIRRNAAKMLKTLLFKLKKNIKNMFFHLYEEKHLKHALKY